jgi:hypothetical protein
MSQEENDEIVRPLLNFMERVHQTALAKGWWDDIKTSEVNEPDFNEVSGRLILVMRELSEAVEEMRIGRYTMYFNKKKPDKPEGFSVELADAFLRMCDLVRRLGLDEDFVQALLLKAKYNETRSYRHGGKLG